MAANQLESTSKSFTEIEVYDSESKKLIKRTADEQRESFNLHNSIISLDLLKGMALKKILEEKRYLDFQCNNFEQYCQLYLDMTYRQIHTYINIADMISEMLPGYNLENLKLKTGEQNDTDLKLTSGLKSILKLGVTKLSALSRYEKKDVKTLYDEGEIISKVDGKRYTIDDLRLMTTKEVQEKLLVVHNEEKKALRKENQKLREDNKLLRKENETIKSRHEYAFELEKKYGPNAHKLEEKIDCLNKAYNHLSDFNRYLAQAHVQIDDPLEVIERLQAIVRSVEIFREHLLPKYGGIVNELLSDSKANKY